jgi:hypothetical protein
MTTSSSCNADFEFCAGFEYPAPPLFQSTYKNYRCDTSSCRWAKDYRLSPMQTKEFRFYCTGSAGDLFDWDVGISNRKDSTTCTIGFPVRWDPDYVSKSCTNWSLTEGDRITLKLSCW